MAEKVAKQVWGTHLVTVTFYVKNQCHHKQRKSRDCWHQQISQSWVTDLTPSTSWSLETSSIRTRYLKKCYLSHEYKNTFRRWIVDCRDLVKIHIPNNRRGISRAIRSPFLVWRSKNQPVCKFDILILSRNIELDPAAVLWLYGFKSKVKFSVSIKL